MKYLKPGSEILSQETEADAEASKALLESQVNALNERLRELPAEDTLSKAEVMLEMGRILMRLECGAEAWQVVRDAFDIFLEAEEWERAVEATDILFLADQPESLAALGQGIWLAVTYPINAELTVAMLQHIVDETADHSDGAAVAAITAHYIADLRAEGKAKGDLAFFTNRMMATVARRHSQVQKQKDFDAWIKRLELDDPAKFLVRLRNIVDVMVQDGWWFDREALQQKLPVN